MIISEHTISPEIPYSDRAEKAEFIMRHFGWAIKYPILDVGCGEQNLKRNLPEGSIYKGIDFAGHNDLNCDLDKGTIPLETESFATVVCTDVLEHLENIHQVLMELFRLSRKYVIISLPNCWCDMKYLMYGRGSGSGKYYGLPISRPPDRHRWFFNYSEAREFLIGNLKETAKKGNFFKYYGRKGRTYYAAKVFLPADIFDDLFVNTIWAIFEK